MLDQLLEPVRAVAVGPLDLDTQICLVDPAHEGAGEPTALRLRGAFLSPQIRINRDFGLTVLRAPEQELHERVLANGLRSHSSR